MRTSVCALSLTLAALAAPASSAAVTPPAAPPPWTAPAVLSPNNVAAEPSIDAGTNSVTGAWGDAAGVHWGSRHGIKGEPGSLRVSDVAGTSVQYHRGRNSGNVIVWIEGGQVFAAVTKPEGQFGTPTIQAKKLVSTGNAAPASGLVLAGDDEGDAAVAWVQNVSGIPQVHAATAKVSEDFGAPVQISNGTTADESAAAPDVAVQSGGNTTVVYTQGNGLSGGLHAEIARVRQQTTGSSGAFTPPVILAGSGGVSVSDLSVAHAGASLWVAWARSDEVETRVQTTSGGAFLAADTLSNDPATGAASSPEVTGSTQRIVIAWLEEETPGGTKRVRAAHGAANASVVAPFTGFFSPDGLEAEDISAEARDDRLLIAFRAGGYVWAVRRDNVAAPFEGPHAVSRETAADGDPAVAISGSNDVVGWRDDATGRFLYVGYDKEPPHLVDFGPSATAEAGKSRQWIISTVEAWGDVTTTWNFGDGSAPLQGDIVNYAYPTPGKYTQTVTAVDWIGLTSTRSRTVTVTPAQVQNPPPPPPPPNKAPSGTIGKLAKKVKTKKLKAFTGTASDDRGIARVEIALVKIAKKPRCQQLTGPAAKFGTLKPDKKKRCIPTKYLKATGTAKWSYKLTKKLPVGSYALYARVVDTDGATTTLKAVTFKVVK